MPNQVKKYGSIDVSGLKNFESMLGRSFPEDYRLFLMETNGGEFEPCYFNIDSNGKDFDRVTQFYGFHKGLEYYRLNVCYKNYLNRIPKELVSIGSDPFGNQICISCFGGEQGSIWFWDHEVDEGKKLLSCVRLADNFNEFFGGLYKYDDYSEDSIDELLECYDMKKIEYFISSNYEIDSVDEYGRSFLERASIKNRYDIVELLFNRGASLRNSLKLAQKNLEYFPEYIKTVNLIKKLQ
jgi:hypothetical protein